jgi:hypothetical protein
MDGLGQLDAEFESLGEAAVAERLSVNAYKGEARAVAMRWLNEKSLARAGIGTPHHAAPLDPATRRIVRAEQGARVAILCAVAALTAAIGSLGLSLQTLHAVQDLGRTAAAAAEPPSPKS